LPTTRLIANRGGPGPEPAGALARAAADRQQSDEPGHSPAGSGNHPDPGKRKLPENASFLRIHISGVIHLGFLLLLANALRLLPDEPKARLLKKVSLVWVLIAAVWLLIKP
jgi:hypothetical protein